MAEIKYKPEYADMLIEHMKKGLSFQTFGAQVGVVRATIYNWIEEYPEFKKAKDIGTALAQDFMEKRLVAKISGQEIKGLKVKDIDTSSLIFALKTRFHKTYGDKHEVEHTGEVKIHIDSDDAKL